MKAVDRLRIESRLAFKGRATIAICILLFLFVVYAYISSYQMVAGRAVSQEEHMIPVYGVEAYKSWLQENPEAANIRETFQNLKPVAGPNYVLSVFAVVGPMLAAIWGALFFGNEFVWRTAKVRAAHYGWASSVKTKMLLMSLANLMIGLIGSLAGLVGGYITWNLILRATEISMWVGVPIITTSFWQQLLVLWLGLSVYGFLGGLIALAVKSPLVGGVSGFFVPYAEAYIGKMFPAWWLPHTAYSELMADSFAYFPSSIVLITPNESFAAASPYLPWAVTGGWLLFFYMSMVLLSMRQKIT